VPTSQSSEFASAELDRLDQAFARLPRAHLLPPNGLRQMGRAPCLTRAGHAYPSVMAEFSARQRGASFFDAAFIVLPGTIAADSPDPVCMLAHALIGCSLATNATLYRAFARRLGRPDASPASVVLLDQGAFGRLPSTDLRSLPPGVDFGIGYALFVNHPEALAASAPDVFGLLERQLFAANESDASRVVGEAGQAMIESRFIRG
jgi:hypothetical protein